MLLWQKVTTLSDQIEKKRHMIIHDLKSQIKMKKTSITALVEHKKVRETSQEERRQRKFEKYGRSWGNVGETWEEVIKHGRGRRRNTGITVKSREYLS
jgi:hypothetical protein